ncbi:hypothetical protein ACFSLT_26290 [Novosphingobium resinovorum]
MLGKIPCDQAAEIFAPPAMMTVFPLMLWLVIHCLFYQMADHLLAASRCEHMFNI